MLHYDGRGNRIDLDGAEQSDDPVGELDEQFAGLVDDLLAAHVGFDFGDEILLKGHAEIEDDRPRIVVGETAYETVVVPHCETLQSSTVDLLESFDAAGGEVLVVGDEPTLVDG